MFLTEEQKQNEFVKSLLAGGFEEEFLADLIKNGNLPLEKSVPAEEKEEEKPTPEPAEPKDGDGEKPADEKPEDGAGDEKDPVEKGCGDGEKPEDIAKSVTAEVMKSLEGAIDARNEDIIKSIGGAIAEAVKPYAEKVDALNKSVSDLETLIKSIGDSAPAFKSAGLNRVVIEKSMGGRKDEDEKTILSVSRDRAVVRSVIEKAIDEEKDDTLQKSLREDAQGYFIDPLYGELGETVARYMYEKKNVRLVK